MFTDMRTAKKLAVVAPKFALTLPDGVQIFSEKFSTVEAYMANQLAEKLVAKMSNRGNRMWEQAMAPKPAVRKPLFDRKAMMPSVPSAFGAMIAAELQKAGL